jgi:hypothetical protein
MGYYFGFKSQIRGERNPSLSVTFLLLEKAIRFFGRG